MQAGEICFVQDAEKRLTTIYGFPVRLDPAFVNSRASMPTPRQFLVRLLSNLRLVYQGLRMPEPLYAIIRSAPDYLPSNLLCQGFHLRPSSWLACGCSLPEGPQLAGPVLVQCCSSCREAGPVDQGRKK